MLIFLIFSLFLSCQNTLSNFQNSNFSFNISRSSLPEGSYKVKCILTGNVEELQIKEFDGQNIENLKFDFNNIPVNKLFSISVEIYSLDTGVDDLKYKGTKDVVLTKSKNDIQIEIVAVTGSIPGGETGETNDLVDITNYNFAIGDIVFSDNTVLPYAKSKEYNDDKWNKIDRTKAIAVIFKETTGTTKALGVGVQQSSSTLKWANSDYKKVADGYTNKIDSLVCTPSNYTNSSVTWDSSVTFNGTQSGKNSWQAICEKCSDTENASEKYPAFYFANTYGTVVLMLDSNEDFAKNWYIPSIAEIVEIYKEKDNINSILTIISNSPIKESFYWTSSQAGTQGGAMQAWLIDMSDSKYQPYSKSYENYVLTIREF